MCRFVGGDGGTRYQVVVVCCLLSLVVGGLLSLLLDAGGPSIEQVMLS